MSFRLPRSLPRVSLPTSILFLVLLNLALPPVSLSVCPVPKIKANGEFFKASAVFVGEVKSVRVVPDRGNDLGGWFYRLRVEETFRGPVGDELTVFTENASARFPLEVNHEYLLFAYKWGRGLQIDSCGNSALLPEAKDSLQRLRNLRRGKQPTEIEGWVVPETNGIDVSGITVTIKGPSAIYTALTDKDGWFHFIAPPGNYKVDFSSHEYYLNGADFYWYESDNFVLHPGECASLQFISVRHSTN